MGIRCRLFTNGRYLNNGCAQTRKKSGYKRSLKRVSGDGEVVSVAAICSEDLSSNPTETCSYFSVNFLFVANNKDRQIESVVGQIKRSLKEYF